MGSIRRALTRRTAGVAVWSLVIGTAIGLAPTAAYGAAESTPTPSATVTADPTPEAPGDDTGPSVTPPADETSLTPTLEPTPEPTSSVEPDPQPEVTSSPTPTVTPDEDATPGPDETGAAETPAAPTPEPTTATPSPSRTTVTPSPFPSVVPHGVSNTASISGTVTGPGGSVTEIVGVGLYRQTSYDGGTYWSYVTWNATSPDGTYAFTGLTAGTYTLEFFPLSDSDLQGEWWNNKPDQESATSFSLTAGQKKTGVNAQLAKSATISGTVTKTGGAAVADASVVLYRQRGSGSATYWSWYTSTRTAPDGTYSFRGLGAGKYTTAVSASGQNLLSEWWNDKAHSSTADAISLGAGQTFTANTQLALGASISGVVTGPGGSPVAGARVSVFERAPGSGGTAWWSTASAATDSSGAYSVVGLDAGEYTVAFSPPLGVNLLVEWLTDKSSLDAADSFSLSAGQVKTDVSAQLAAGSTITVTVTNSSGNPAPGVSLGAYTKNGDFATGTEQTDSAGSATFVGLRPGDYTIAAVGDDGARYLGGSDVLSGAEFITLSAEDAAEAELSFAGVTVSGTATVGGTGAIVTSGYVQLSSGTGGVGTTTPISPDGTYSFTGVRPGAYTLSVRPQNPTLVETWWDGATAEWDADYFSVGSSSVSKNVSVARAGSVSGTATNLTGSGVNLYRIGPGGQTAHLSYSYVSDGGTFTFSHVAPGTYSISVWTTGSEQWLGGGTAPAEAQTFTVKPAANTNIGSVSLGSQGGTVTGTITAPGGASVVGAYVGIYDADGTYVGGSSISGSTYALAGVAAGSYTLSVVLPGYATYWYGGTNASNAAEFTVANGQTRTVNVSLLANNGSVSGTVTSTGGGGAVASAEVYLYPDATSWSSIASATTNSAGQYSLPASVYAGRTYYLRVYSPDGTLAAGERTFTAVSGPQTQNFALARTGRITGTLTDRIAGGAVSGVSVYAYSTDGTYAQGVTRDDGSYSLESLRPGSYTVRFGTYSSGYSRYISGYSMAATPYYTTEWLGTTGTTSGATLLSVSGGATKDAGAGSVEQAAVITGRISGSAGGSQVGWLRGVQVSAYTASGDLADTAWTGATAPGSYTLAVKQGTYKICATGPQETTFGSACWTASGSSSSGSPSSGGNVSATRGQTTSGIDIVLGVMPAITSAVPKITGTAKVGQTLTAVAGSWTRGASFTYQWLANGAPISGATTSKLKLTNAHAGKKISVTVTGSKPGYLEASETSSQTASVAGGALAAPTPTISGTAAVGSTLTAKPGSWTSGTTLKYQWYANGSAISGATKSAFTVTSSQVDKSITVKVTGSKSGYTTTSKTSKATAKVLKTATPTISGAAKVGSTVTAKPGTWTSGTTMKYQWYANGAAIKGAVKSTFTLTSAQAGKSISVKVTGSKSGYVTVSKTSNATGNVAR